MLLTDGGFLCNIYVIFVMLVCCYDNCYKNKLFRKCLLFYQKANEWIIYECK